MSEETSTNEERHRVLALYKFCRIKPEKVPKLKEEIESELRKFKARGTILLACEGINGTICYPENLVVKTTMTRNNEKKNDQKDGDYNDQNDHGRRSIDSIVEYFQKSEIFNGLRTRISFASTPIFHRLKVKVKKEIVTMTGDDHEELVIQNVPQEEGKDSCSKNGNDKFCTIECNPKKKHKKEKFKADPTEVVGRYVKPGKEWDDLLLDPDVVVIDTRNKYEVEIGTFENAISPCTDNFR